MADIVPPAKHTLNKVDEEDSDGEDNMPSYIPDVDAFEKKNNILYYGLHDVTQKHTELCIYCKTMPTIYKCYNKQCGKAICGNCSIDVSRWCSDECKEKCPYVQP